MGSIVHMPKQSNEAQGCTFKSAFTAHRVPISGEGARCQRGEARAPITPGPGKFRRGTGADGDCSKCLSELALSEMSTSHLSNGIFVEVPWANQHDWREAPRCSVAPWLSLVHQAIKHTNVLITHPVVVPRHLEMCLNSKVTTAWRSPFQVLRPLQARAFRFTQGWCCKTPRLMV